MKQRGLLRLAASLLAFFGSFPTVVVGWCSQNDGIKFWSLTIIFFIAYDNIVRENTNSCQTNSSTFSVKI